MRRRQHGLLQGLVVIVLTIATFTPAQAASSPDTVYVEPAAGVAPLVAFIAHAQHSLDGEVYLVSSKPVLAALEAAAARHVTVRLNLEQHPYGTGTAAPALVYRTLAAHSVQVRWTSPTFTYTHAKYLVADQHAAWIGTMIM
jgi:cardiolipin synthase